MPYTLSDVKVAASQYVAQSGTAARRKNNRKDLKLGEDFDAGKAAAAGRAEYERRKAAMNASNPGWLLKSKYWMILSKQNWKR